MNGMSGHIQPRTSAATITKNNGAYNNQAILFIAVNGNSLPSVFIIPRGSDNEIGVAFEGTVKKTDLSIDNNGAIIVSGFNGNHIYYRIFNMELP